MRAATHVSFDSDENVFRTLRSQLSHFGLNPFEWTVFSKLENSYHFSHREDPTFQISAVVRTMRTGGLQVEEVAVTSL